MEIQNSSSGAQNQKELQNQESFIFSPDEQEQLRFITKRLDSAKTQRNSLKKYLDDLDFLQDYEANKDAMNSYLREKLNDDEVRVNTGTTEKKIESLVNEILSFNYQSEVLAFDRDDREIVELGNDMGDMVQRTHEMEKDDDLRMEALLELIGQRALFIEELTEEKDTNGFVIKRPVKRILSALQVFLGDISLPAYRFQEQPYIGKYYRMNYWNAKQIYGHYKNWNYVKPGMNVSTDWCGGEFNWRLGTVNEDEVEIIKYESAPDNEFQLIINGVPLLSVGEKLPWKHEGYNTIMIITKSMGRHIAYGKPTTASMKFIQGLSDETVRDLIFKFRQAITPPVGTAVTGKIYSRDIWGPGKVTYGVKENTFHKLIEHQGVTDSEFAMWNEIQKIASDFASRTSTDLGLMEGKKITATQLIEMRKQAIKMLGLIILGWSRAVRDMDYLRIYNLIENFMDSERQEMDSLNNKVSEVFRTFTMKNTSFEDETKGTKIIHFTDQEMDASYEDKLLEHEDKLKEKGYSLRIKYLNVKKLREFPVMWYISVSPREKEDSALFKILFQDKLAQAAGINKITGRQLNPDKVIEEYEMTWKTKNWFKEPEPQPIPGMENMNPKGQPTSGMGGEMKSAMRKPANRPKSTDIVNMPM